MYNYNKTIEDVLKYLYEQKKEELAKVVLDLIRANERANNQPTLPCLPYTIGDPIVPPYTITCSVGDKEER